MKHLYIIRGLPGSGKTTLAHHIGYEVFEVDMFFTNEVGIYRYDREKIGEAHQWCQNSVRAAMNAGCELIAVSNTFVGRWEMQPYYDMAKELGYAVTEITLSGELHNSIHNVPKEKIEAMRLNWER